MVTPQFAAISVFISMVAFSLDIVAQNTNVIAESSTLH